MSETPDTPQLMPARMLNEFTYCPRLFHLEHIDRQWADNAFTTDGKNVHRRVDRVDQVLPEILAAQQEVGAQTEAEPSDEKPQIARSVKLSSERLGLIAKMDLVAVDGNEAVPVDTKRGKAPDVAEGAWEPERVQVMAQGLLLREHGYRSERGVLYFAGSRRRVDVPFTAELEARTLQLLEQARVAANNTVMPDPLESSPKCNGCSLAPICLPDETLALKAIPRDPTAPEARRLYPSRDLALPFYVVEQGAKVGKNHSRLVVRKDGKEIARAQLRDVSQVVLCGNVQISTQSIHLLCEAAIPVVFQSRGGWFYGMASGLGLRNGYLRDAQYRLVATRPDACVAFGAAALKAKVANQRTLLRRNANPRSDTALRDLARATKRLADPSTIRDLSELIGHEGAAAATYFGQFGAMLREPHLQEAWGFEHRSRRPPRDPVNALLSFGYALLAKDCTTALLAEGLDPFWGLVHQARHGRPSLALDLMEEFRPLIVDSAVLTAVNTGMVGPRDFQTGASGCVMKADGRRAFIRAYEMRMDQLATHPIFGYRCAWRSIVKMQARFLGRWIRGDIPAYVGVETR